jgi:DeoR/GlpR family transcriptional regulator of sugar metabolism
MVVKAERQKQLLEAISQYRKITITELSGQFDVSDITIRRDLKTLEEQGLVQLAHGGMVYSKPVQQEPPIIQRQQIQRDAKLRIAARAASLITDGESVFIGSGSTAYFVARCLKHQRQVTVVTNALSIVNELADDTNINLIVLGGMLRTTELSMIGHITEQALREVRVDKVIFGIRAIDVEAGLTNDYMPEIMTDRAILDMGSQVILVADHSKFGRIASAFVAPIHRVSTVITDNQSNRQILSQIDALGVTVIVADGRIS